MPKGYKGREKSERLHMLIAPSELSEIDDWRFANKIGTRAEAVRRLIQIGLAYSRDAENLHLALMEMNKDLSERAQQMMEISGSPSNSDPPKLTRHVISANEFVQSTFDHLSGIGGLAKITDVQRHYMDSGDIDFETARTFAKWHRLRTEIENSERALDKKLAEFERDKGKVGE